MQETLCISLFCILNHFIMIIAYAFIKPNQLSNSVSEEKLHPHPSFSKIMDAKTELYPQINRPCFIRIPLDLQMRMYNYAHRLFRRTSGSECSIHISQNSIDVDEKDRSHAKKFSNLIRQMKCQAQDIMISQSLYNILRN